MSTIKVNNIDPPNVGEGVSIDGLQMPTAGPLSNRNLIINGAMQVAQRATSVTGVTGSTYNAVDRFLSNINNLGTWTVSQEVDAPVGFKYSLKHTCTTADSSPAASDYAIVYHRIETQNIAPQIGYGTSSAKDLTLSFWVKSNKTGAASAGIFATVGTNRFTTLQYTINSADTWEYKTLTFSPLTTAAIDGADNAIGMTVEWWMNSGSAFSGTAATGWVVDGPSRNAYNIGIGGAVGDYFQITGVQLEVGSKATPFEHRSYADDVNQCKRYLQLVNPNSGGGYAVNHWAFRDTGNWIVNLWHYPEMRVAPSLIAIGDNGLTGLPSNQVGLYNISTSGAVSFDNNTGQWDITMATLHRSTLRFSGTNLQGTTGNIAGSDSMIVNTLLFVSAEL